MKNSVTGIKISTLKQMVQKLPIVLAQVKAGNTSEKLLKKIGKIIDLLYLEEGISTKFILF